MVDITAKLFWYRTKEWCQIMADKVNDFVYTDEKKETVDVINLILLGWILLGLIVYIVGNVVATYLRKRKSILSPIKTETADDKTEVKEHVSSCASSRIETLVEDIKPLDEKLEISNKIPICEGDDPETLKWINSVFSWIYNQRVVSPVIDAWLSALNARTRLSSTEHGILVDFKDVHYSSGSPKITNALLSSNSKCDTSISCDTEIEDIIFDVVVSQFKEKEKVSHPFTLNVKRLAGKVYVECVPEEATFVTRYSEVPQVQLSAETAGNHAVSQEDLQPLNDLICEITTEALSSAILNLKLACYPDCPRLLQKSYSDDDVFEAAEEENEKRLLVKIIKASNLGGKEGCVQPYCVVEVDEPPQRFETHSIEEKYNPFWDESYTFVVKDISAELLFEVYDKTTPKEKFLGLGIVSVDELLRNPSQRQMIPLQSRPLENDNVTGTLTAEFLFLNQLPTLSEATHLSNAKTECVTEAGKSVETNCRVTAGGTVITTTTIKRTNEENIHSSEVASNLHANSKHSTENNLIPMHDVKEIVLSEKNVSGELISEVSNGITTLSNGNLNGHIKSNNKVSNILNLFDNQIESNDTQLNIPKPTSFVETNKDKVEDDCQIEIKSELPQNGVSQIACSPLHVHDVPIIVPKTPVIILDDSIETLNGNGSLLKSDQNSSENTMNENANYDNEMQNVLKGVDSEINSDLPTIAENIEFNLSPLEVFENDDGETDLTGAALKEIEKLSKPNATSKSTLIIHSVQRPDSSVSESLEASPASHLSRDSNTSYSESVPSSPTLDKSLNRSRPKEKKSFIGSLRRRLSFHKTRSKSAENHSEEVSAYSQASSRSASTDRIRHPSSPKQSPYKERLLGQFLNVPGKHSLRSTRSSISEASGVSGLSTRTYINENSTLVIETNENGIIKRYLIPNSLIHRSKWKKRGTKLHIYNDHVFIAKHLSGSTLCQVCQKHLTRRPGKQGYECRGCNLQCHKSCHVKVENFCSNSSVNSMEVEYIHDPKGASPKSI